LDLAVSALEGCGASYALIGAAALAVHGVARSTFDIDILTTALAVLESGAWAGAARQPGTTVELRRGEADDPLAGVVTLSAAGQPDVDIVVGRWAWQAAAVGRAEPTELSGRRLPVVRPADLVLLKLYAGGLQDRWDVEQLLSGPDREATVTEVESRIDSLPDDAVGLWRQIARP
jgi:hypothetical protein